MLDWTGKNRGGLRPEDVFDQPARWRWISRDEARRKWSEVPVVAVLRFGPTFQRASWFDPYHAMYDAPSYLEPHGEDYYEYLGEPVWAGQAHETSWSSWRRVPNQQGSQSRSGGSDKQEKPKKKEEPKQETPAKTEEKVCEIIDVAIKCSHGRSPSKDGLLEVVTRESMDSEKAKAKDDKISLKASLKGGCGQHPRWEIAGEVKTGTEATYVAKAHWLKAWRLFRMVSPKEVQISVGACNTATKFYTIREYPCDQVEISLDWNRKIHEEEKTQEEEHKAYKKDLKAAEAMEKYGLSGKHYLDRLANEKKEKTHKPFDYEVTWTPESPLDIKLGLVKRLWDFAEQLAYFEDMIAAVAAPSQKTKIEFLPKISGKFKAGYVEHTDHRAFLKIEAQVVAELIDAEAKIPFGPTSAIPGFLKKFVTDWVGDAYIYIKFAGKLELEGTWARKTPDDWKGSVAAKGEIEVTVGANIFLMKKHALNIDVAGKTKIKPEAEAGREEGKVVVEYDVLWGELKVAVSIEAAFGIVSFKKDWKVFKERSMFGGKKHWMPFEPKDAEGGGHELPAGH